MTCHVVGNVSGRSGMSYFTVPVSRARSSDGPGVVAGSRTMQISNITDAIFKVRTHHT